MGAMVFEREIDGVTHAGGALAANPDDRPRLRISVDGNGHVYVFVNGDESPDKLGETIAGMFFRVDEMPELLEAVEIAKTLSEALSRKR